MSAPACSLAGQDVVDNNGPKESVPAPEITNNATPAIAAEAVLMPSEGPPPGSRVVKGIDFNDYKDRPITVPELMDNMSVMGFQGSHLGNAMDVINEMRAYRNPETGTGPTVFLGYTSNLISSGLRETIRYLVEHKMVSALVSSAGGVEEDFIKCLAPTYTGSFDSKGSDLRSKGLNRIGNLLVPNSNYCAFEDWVVPILDKMADEQEEAWLAHVENRRRREERRRMRKESRKQESESNGKVKLEAIDLEDDLESLDSAAPEFSWTPSKIIHRLGKEINDPSSVYYWAYKNDIPVFCPALTDGSLGDMLYFHTFRRASAGKSAIRCDIVQDIRRINNISVHARAAGMIVLGGGMVKHHIANACLMRNGADWAVYVNTGQEFDGSDAGARPDEAVSWGKIRANAKAVKIHAEATIAFPLLVAATFANPAGSGCNDFQAAPAV